MRKVLMLAVSPVQGIDVLGPLEAFALVGGLLAGARRTEGYSIELVSATADLQVLTSSGVSLLAHARHAEARGPVDTLLVAGGPGARVCQDAGVLAWLRRTAARSRRVCSICTGASLLARAGLLQGRRATTHWKWVDSMALEYPDVRWDRSPIWVQDGHTYTSAGITAGMDLALGLIEEDFGGALALEVARHMVLFLRRPGSQAQFSAALTAQGTDRRSLQELQVWIAENLGRDLSVERLATRSAMSPRNFARVFTRELGVTPARYIEQVRIEAARARLTSTQDTLEQIAGHCGFSSAELLRRAFLRHLGVAPGEYRRRFQERRPALHARRRSG